MEDSIATGLPPGIERRLQCLANRMGEPLRFTRKTRATGEELNILVWPEELGGEG